MFQIVNVVRFPQFNCHAQELVSFVMNKRASKKKWNRSRKNENFSNLFTHHVVAMEQKTRTFEKI